MTQRSKYEITDEMAKRLENNFTYHKPKDDQQSRYVHIREAAHLLAQVIVQNSPMTREQSLALTNLEQAVMWANAAIARNE
jgi:hypothetical protein